MITKASWLFVMRLVFLGPESARLIAQKSKGMPRISVPLRRLIGDAANEAMARLSLDIYKSYKTNHKLLLEGEIYIFSEGFSHFHLSDS